MTHRGLALPCLQGLLSFGFCPFTWSKSHMNHNDGIMCGQRTLEWGDPHMTLPLYEMFDVSCLSRSRLPPWPNSRMKNIGRQFNPVSYMISCSQVLTPNHVSQENNKNMTRKELTALRNHLKIRWFPNQKDALDVPEKMDTTSMRPWGCWAHNTTILWSVHAALMIFHNATLFSIVSGHLSSNTSTYSGSKKCPNVCMFFTKVDNP